MMCMVLLDDSVEVCLNRLSLCRCPSDTGSTEGIIVQYMYSTYIVI